MVDSWWVFRLFDKRRVHFLFFRFVLDFGCDVGTVFQIFLSSLKRTHRQRLHWFCVLMWVPIGVECFFIEGEEEFVNFFWGVGFHLCRENRMWEGDHVLYIKASVQWVRITSCINLGPRLRSTVFLILRKSLTMSGSALSGCRRDRNSLASGYASRYFFHILIIPCMCLYISKGEGYLTCCIFGEIQSSAVRIG